MHGGGRIQAGAGLHTVILYREGYLAFGRHVLRSDRENLGCLQAEQQGGLSIQQNSRPL
jgi:hypothetical protein